MKKIGKIGKIVREGKEKRNIISPIIILKNLKKIIKQHNDEISQEHTD